MYDGIAGRCCSVPGEWWPILGVGTALALRMPCHSREVQQQCGACRPFDGRPDCRVPKSQNQVPLPVPSTARSSASAGREVPAVRAPSADTLSAPAGGHRGPEHRALDRSPRDSHASSDHPGSRSGAGGQSVPGSRHGPTDDAGAAPGGVRFTAPRDRQRERHWGGDHASPSRLNIVTRARVDGELHQLRSLRCAIRVATVP